MPDRPITVDDVLTALEDAAEIHGHDVYTYEIQIVKAGISAPYWDIDVERRVLVLEIP